MGWGGGNCGGSKLMHFPNSGSLGFGSVHFRVCSLIDCHIRDRFELWNLLVTALRSRKKVNDRALNKCVCLYGKGLAIERRIEGFTTGKLFVRYQILYNHNHCVSDYMITFTSTKPHDALIVTSSFKFLIRKGIYWVICIFWVLTSSVWRWPTFRRNILPPYAGTHRYSETASSS